MLATIAYIHTIQKSKSVSQKWNQGTCKPLESQTNRWKSHVKNYLTKRYLEISSSFRI